MQKRAKITVLIIFMILTQLPLALFATHQRAAEISFRWISGFKYEITLTSYTFTPSLANQYRDFLLIDWGDNKSSNIPRVQEDTLGNNITYNRYVGQHEYLAASNYVISCEDPNRNGDILNIPNSVNIPLFIYSELTISPFLNGFDSSPVLLMPPVDNACVNQPFLHNPGAYDPDGDSLSYKLVPCRGALGQPIPGYTYPPATDSLNLNPITGDFYWASPPQQGEYNIAILVEEWRNRVRIGSVLRDMQIIVVACNDNPPVVQIPRDTCVLAGDTLLFRVRAFDPDSNEVTLTGNGQPMILTNSPASLDPYPAIGFGHTETWFNWMTNCEHIRRASYSMFFKATDNASPVNLVDIKSMRIRVVGPAPKNLTATAIGTSILLNWDSYRCQNAKGFYIYRKADSSGFVHGHCETGVPSYLGYTRIDQVDTLANTTYLDNNHGNGLVQGIHYCYLVTAYFKDKAEGYASNEACAYLKKDVAVITNVSINTTDPVNGSAYIAWSKPTEIDTLQAPGPYKYILQRSDIQHPGQFTPIDSTVNLNDTIFTDTLLNTKDNPFRYRVDLMNETPGNKFLIGRSQVASSQFITLGPTDNAMKISWNNDVPWTNYRYVIFRKNKVTSAFDSVGSSLIPSYTDKLLNNGEEYCYKIRSVGKYSASGFVNPIFNDSQSACAVPVDNVPPCPPVLHVRPDCENGINILGWINPYDSCSADIARYMIYYSGCNSGPLTLIDSLVSGSDTSWSHHPDLTIAGCYAIVAVDSVGNRSNFSNKVCVDITDCKDYYYRLPNVFTPNGDNKNDLFTPFPKYTSVEKVELKIFDRWGKEVYETTDPEIRWDSRDRTTGGQCSDGVYFYVCDVYEVTLCGTVKRNLRGSVTILR